MSLPVQKCPEEANLSRQKISERLPRAGGDGVKWVEVLWLKDTVTFQVMKMSQT